MSLIEELRSEPTGRIVLAVFLLIVGVSISFAGADALRTGKIEADPVSDEPAGFIDFEFEGADARRVGVGFLVFAAMSLVCGTALLWPRSLGGPRLGKTTASISFTLLLASMLVWFPPYHVGSRWPSTVVNVLLALIGLAWAAKQSTTTFALAFRSTAPVIGLILVALGLVLGGVDAFAGLIALSMIAPLLALHIAWLRWG